MDVNGSRFQLLLGRDDWAGCTDSTGRALAGAWQQNGRTDIAEVEWFPTRQELTLRSLTPLVVSAPGDNQPTQADRRGAARDRFGNWYWVDETRTELRVGATRKPSSHFWAAADEAAAGRDRRFGDFAFVSPPTLPPLTFGGLAVTTDHYLVAGIVDPGGLAIFDLLAGGEPARWLWATGIEFRPVDLAARAGGGVVVLDRGPDHARYWLLERRLLVEPVGAAVAAEAAAADFSPVEGGDAGTGRAPTARLIREDSAPLHGDPISIEAASDDSVIVLDGAARSIQRYTHGAPAGAAVPLEHAVHDMALVADTSGDAEHLGALYVMSDSGNQVYQHSLVLQQDSLTAALERAYYPVRGFTGKAVVAAGDAAFYAYADTWLPIVEQRRRQYLAGGAVVTPPLDGKEPGCVWHRLLLDACLPSDTTLHVSTRCADDPERLTTATWHAEPQPIPRSDGSELPYAPPADDHAYTTWELLFQAAIGRYLQIRLELAGDGRASPRLRALRAYYPRFSYVERYLPGVYREDDTSASFLERFLANPEGILTGLEGRIATAQALFDPRTAPAEALDWLARWFEVALDPAWPEQRRRLFIANAMRYFAMRGTVRGVELALSLALDECVDESLFDQDTPPSGARRVTVVEWFRRRSGGGTELDEATDAAGLHVSDRQRLWQPSHGAVDLHSRFVNYVDPEGTQERGLIQYPLQRPGNEQTAAAWETFSRDTLGFVPSASHRDTPAWQDFLARRYRRPSAIAKAYGATDSTLTNWQDLTLPVLLPSGLRALTDWFQFERVILPMRALAHHFSVLLPVKPPAHPDDHETVARNQALAGLAQRIVELEKPAHTIFDVRFFFSAFRLGDARLGRDTIAELGTRGLGFRPAVLGREHLGEAVLSNGLPADLAARAAASALGSTPWRSTQ
jgi:phage tail-like protein